MYRKHTLKIPPEDYILNPGFLKLDLMLRGVKVDDGIFKKGILQRQFSPHNGLAGGVDLLLPQNTWVTVPYQGDFIQGSPYHLIERDGRYYIFNSKREVKVAIIPQPGFYDKKTSTGIPLSKIGILHGKYIAVTPSSRCDFFNFHIECKYCSAGLREGVNEPNLFSVDEVLETVEAAYKEGNARIVYLTIGFVNSPDGGIELLKPYIKAVKKNFNTIIAVESLPPKEDRWIDETYALGADSVIYNLEIFDLQRFEEICPGRSRLIGRDRYIQALKYAAEIFSGGTVASQLIVGIEPPESTVRGIDLLTDIGVVPILPVLRPFTGLVLQGGKMPITEEIAPIYGYLYRTIKKKRINMNWVRDMSIVTTPLEGRFFVGEEATLSKMLHGFYKSSLGTKTAWGLATLRRKLRVKTIG